MFNHIYLIIKLLHSVSIFKFTSRSQLLALQQGSNEDADYLLCQNFPEETGLDVHYQQKFSYLAACS
jgi:hypothetical protein